MTEVAEGQERPDDHVDRRGFLRKLLGRGAVVAAGAGAATTLMAEPAAAVNEIVMSTTNPAPSSMPTVLIGSPFQVTNTAGTTRAVTGSVTDTDAIAIEATSTNGAAARVVPRGDLDPDTNFPPTTGTWSAGSVLADVNGDFWYCYLGGVGAASGWYPFSLVPSFIPLTSPVRMYDSRAGLDPVGVEKGKLGHNIDRNILSTVNGAAPVTAFTVLVNLTVVNTSAVGWMSVRAAGAPYLGHTNITWYGPSQIIGNTMTASTDINGFFTVRGGGTPADFVIDSLGFYTLTF